jgi:hypothetical protein
MVPVSIVDWQYIPWVKKWDQVFEISRSDFQKLKSWLAVIIDQEVVDIIVEEKEEDIIVEEKYSIEDKIDILITALSEISENEELLKLADFIQNK